MQERTAIRKILKALETAGLDPTVVDYGDGETVEVSSVSEAVEEVMAVDEAFVVLSDGRWVRFVLGNEWFEVLCDHTASLSDIIDPVTEGWY